jgi:hypothetical protein
LVTTITKYSCIFTFQLKRIYHRRYNNRNRCKHLCLKSITYCCGPYCKKSTLFVHIESSKVLYQYWKKPPQ